MASTMNYWWVTRPKRKLNSIPEVLSTFSYIALTEQWTGAKNKHIRFEDQLEKEGLKQIGERRDNSGSGGRTYQAWLSSLGLIKKKKKTGIPFLTYAGEAIMEGKSPVEVLKNQVLKYQFPSPFGIKNRVADKFRIHPFIFLLKLLMDKRIGSLSCEEIGKVVITEAINESAECYEYVIERILSFREKGDASLPADFIENHKSSRGSEKSENPYSHLLDAANTMINWLEYTQLIFKICPD